METILVTGGAGFIGSTFSRIAIEKGHSIRIVDNLSSGSQEVADELQKLGAEIMIGDIRDSDVMNTALQGVDFVVHLAAQISVPLSMEYPEETADINIHGTKGLTTHSNMASNGLSCIKRSCLWREYESPLDETDGGMLLSPYAESKWENEKQILDEDRKDWNALLSGSSTFTVLDSA